jgi:hypothetical protein
MESLDNRFTSQVDFKALSCQVSLPHPTENVVKQT